MHRVSPGGDASPETVERPLYLKEFLPSHPRNSSKALSIGCLHPQRQVERSVISEGRGARPPHQSAVVLHGKLKFIFCDPCHDLRRAAPQRAVPSRR